MLRLLRLNMCKLLFNLVKLAHLLPDQGQGGRSAVTGGHLCPPGPDELQVGHGHPQGSQQPQPANIRVFNSFQILVHV